MNNPIFTCTIITARDPDTLSKAIRLREDGTLEKIQGGQLYVGCATKCQFTIEEFAAELKKLGPNEALCYGVTDYDEAWIVTQRKLEEGYRPDKNDGIPVVARTDACMHWPEGAGMMMVDVDVPKDTGEPVPVRDVLRLFYIIWPALRKAPLLTYPSASTYIYNKETGEEIVGEGGFRIYVPVMDAVNIPLCGARLFNHLWLHGKGRIEVSEAGHFLERSLVDGSVWQPSRLDFAGGAKCEEMLEQRRPDPVIRNADKPFVSTTTLRELTAKEMAQVEALIENAKAAKKAEAEKKRETWTAKQLPKMLSRVPEIDKVAKSKEYLTILQNAVKNRQLLGDFELHFKKRELGTVRVREVLANPDRYHEQTLLDPLEPDYNGGANFCAKCYSKGKHPKIHSFAHGARIKYRLFERPFHVLTTDRYGNPKWTPLNQRKTAEVIAGCIEDLVFNCEIGEWFQYKSGVWKKISKHAAKKRVDDAIHELDPDYDYRSDFLSGTTEMLSLQLGVAKFVQPQDAIPLRNGVLFLNDMNLRPHRRDYYFTSQLPYCYDPLATCEPVVEWMKWAMNGEDSLVELLRAYLNAVVAGRARLQKYLEMIGVGGGGKGTYTRLAIALVGEDNIVSTSLKHLEDRPFETARLYGKKLCLITDADKYAGDVSVLKALTGYDEVRYEEKNNPHIHNFTFEGMVLIASNRDIGSSDQTSGLQRRRITVRFNKVIQDRDRRDLDAEFAPYLPGVLNWVLLMPGERVEQLLKDTLGQVQAANRAAYQAMVSNNPIAAWVDEHVVAEPGVKTYTGSLQYDDNKAIKNARDRLYPSYCQWCAENRKTPLATNSWTNDLLDLLTAQLKMEGVEKRRDSIGPYILGIKVRSHAGDEPSPLEIFFRTSVCDVDEAD
jgi:putative DNA primase/helicase